MSIFLRLSSTNEDMALRINEIKIVIIVLYKGGMAGILTKFEVIYKERGKEMERECGI